MSGKRRAKPKGRIQPQKAMTTKQSILPILFLIAAAAAAAQEPPAAEASFERPTQQQARETDEQRAGRTLDAELRELLRRIPDSLRADGWLPGAVVVDGRLLEPVALPQAEAAIWNMPQRQQITPIERDFVRRLTSGWLILSNGQAFNWEYGRRIWGVGAIYPGSYLDARTLSFPLPR